MKSSPFGVAVSQVVAAQPAASWQLFSLKQKQKRCLNRTNLSLSSVFLRVLTTQIYYLIKGLETKETLDRVDQATTKRSVFRLVFERMPQNSLVCSHFSPLDMLARRKRSVSHQFPRNLPSCTLVFPRGQQNSSALAVRQEDTAMHLCLQLGFSSRVQSQTGSAVGFVRQTHDCLYSFSCCGQIVMGHWENTKRTLEFMP